MVLGWGTGRSPCARLNKVSEARCDGRDMEDELEDVTMKEVLVSDWRAYLPVGCLGYGRISHGIDSLTALSMRAIPPTEMSN